MKTAIIYTRVSTDEQANGYSLRAQKEELERFAAQKGIQVIGHYEDDASAKSFNRPEFQNLLKYLKKNKGKVNYLLVSKWDRFSRNATESLVMIRTLESMQVEVNAITQWIDFSIPENLLLLMIYVSSPEVENVRRGMNVKAGMRKAMLEGRWCNNSPMGYKYMRDERNKPVITPNDKGPLIAAMFEEYASSLINQQDLRRKYNRLGLSMQKSHISRVLSNPIYMGYIRVPAWKDQPEQMVKAVHEPLVTENLFYQVQDKLNGNTRCSREKPSNVYLPLRGIIKCDSCGKYLTGSGSRGRHGKIHYYYHCSKGCKERIKAQIAHDHIKDSLAEIEPITELLNLYEIVFESLVDDSFKDQARQLDKINADLKSLDDKSEKLEEKFILDQIEPAVYSKWKTSFENQRQKLMTAKESGSKTQHLKRQFKGVLPCLSNLPKTFEKADPATKKAIIGSLYAQNFRFSKTESRTPQPNSLTSIILLTNKKLRNKKAQKKGTSSGNSLAVVRRGIEPLLPG